MAGQRLALCEGGVDGDPPYLRPDGRAWSLQIVESPREECVAIDIDAQRDDISWFKLVPENVAENTVKGLGLLGVMNESGFHVSEVIPLATDPSPPQPRDLTLPVDEDLLKLLDIATFGAEERAVLQAASTDVSISCTRGTRPAGMLLTAEDRRLPKGAQLSATITYKADADFSFGVSGPDQLRRESPSLIGALTASGSSRTTTLALPTIETDGRHGFSILCPADSGTLTVQRLVLQPADDMVLQARATWIWRHNRWSSDPAELVSELVDAAMTTVFVAIPLGGSPLRVTQPDALARFIDIATDAGIAVWAVEGDPEAITPEGRNNFRSRAHAFVEFNSGRRMDQRLRGIQYDIEPYLIRGFDLDPETWLAAYIETLRELHEIASVPIEAAVPFWWADLDLNGRPVIDAMAQYVVGITVMNYRTESQQILANAAPYLKWGHEYARHVRMALEAGPIEDQTLHNYRPSRTGRVWQIEIGSETALLLRKAPAANPHGPTFARSHDSPVPASRTTFHGQREKLDALLPRVIRQWSAWPAYAGVALHEYLPD
ncbi:MAG: hypothetical protein ACN4GT_01315 [Gammaproteobacteria bacterium]